MRQLRRPVTRFNGTPLNFVNRLENLSEVETNGWDITANYTFDAGPTSWNISLNGTYVEENTFFPFAGRRGRPWFDS